MSPENAVTPTRASFEAFLGDAARPIWSDELRRELDRLEQDGVVWVTRLGDPPIVPNLLPFVRDRTVLSLGSLEGNLEWTLLRAGTRCVVGVEGYPPNYRKCAVLSKAFGALPLTFICSDLHELHVRDAFDVVVCAGVLYHLHRPDVVLERIRAVGAPRFFLTTQLATDPPHPAHARHGLGARATIGKGYSGRWWQDRRSNVRDYRAGLDGRASFWFDPDALRCCLTDLGFEVASWIVQDKGASGLLLAAELTL